MIASASKLIWVREKLLPAGPALVALALALSIWTYAPHYWTTGLLREAIGWTLGIFVVAALLRIALQGAALAALLGVVAVYFAFGVGLNETVAVIVFLASAQAVGAGVLWICGARAELELDFSRSLAVGLVAYVALFGALLHTNANAQGTYFAILLTPLVVALCLRSHREGCRLALAEAAAGLQRLPFWPFVATFALMGFVARFAFFPTVGADDVAVHLRLWTELTYRGRAAFDAGNDVWAVEPFANDLMHSVVSLISRADARPALDVALAALLLRQIWVVLTALRVDDREKLLALALFASTPLLAYSVTTLQTDLLLAWLAVLGVTMLVNRPKFFEIGDFLALGAVAALCAATKLPAFALGGALFAVGVAKAFAPRARADAAAAFHRWPIIAVVFAVYAFAAVHSYVVAYLLTGNPVLPMLNGVFCSGFMACVNFADHRWTHGFGLRSYFGLFFDTQRYMEAANYTAGFQYLFLFPVGLVLIWRRWRSWDAAAICAPLLIYGLAMFSQTSYLRYLFAVAGLASVAAAALPMRGPGVAPRLVRFAILTITAANLFFLPGISYRFTARPQMAYSPQDRESFGRVLAPNKAVTLDLNQFGVGLRVLYSTSNNAGASLMGEPLYVGAYGRSQVYRRLKDDKAIAAFLRDERVDAVITSPDTVKGSADALVADYMARNGEPILTLDMFSVLKVREQPVAYRRLFDLGTPTPANGIPRPLAHIETAGATKGRYSVRFTCLSVSGEFVAQVHWDKGPPYFKLIACHGGEQTFTDAFTIPMGSRSGDISLATHAADGAQVNSLSLEAN